MTRVQRELLQDLGREPTPRELAKALDTTPEKVLEMRQYVREPLSLDQTLGDEGDAQLGDFIEDAQAVTAVDAVSFTQLQNHLRSVLTTLTDREANIIRLRFGLTDGQPRTLEHVGHLYGICENESDRSNPKRRPSSATPHAPPRSMTTSINHQYFLREAPEQRSSGERTW